MRPSPPTRFRASPNLVTYWSGGAHRILNFATRTEVRATPIVVQLVSALQEWRSSTEAAHALGVPAQAPLVGELIDRLVRASILRRSDSALDPAEAAMDRWASWNPAVGHFHAMTTGVSFVEYDGPHRRRRPPSKPVVARAGIRVALRRPDTSDRFAQVLLSRRTWRRFAHTSIDCAAVERLLWLTAGVHGWLDTPAGDRLPLTTSPSGGARHPIDVCVLALHVRGLRSGLYRYDGIGHTLTSIGPPPRRIREYLPQQFWYEDAAAIAFLCATYGRTLDRYTYPRAYRSVLVEAGHVCQTFCLTATALGLAPFCTMALDDRHIDADLGLDGITSGVVYAAGVGVRFPEGPPSDPEPPRDPRVRRRATRRDAQEAAS
jgi:SagB-type dehydrogenase family enzyme